MTEIFNRRPRGARFLAALAAATTVGAMLPLFGTAVASAAAPVCAAPTNLTSFDASRSGITELKDPVLTWSPAAGASAYEVQISPNQDFSNNIFLDDTTIATRYEPAVLALTHGSYFWRVRAAGATCWSNGSGTPASFDRGWADCPDELIPVLPSARPTNCDSGNVVSGTPSAAQLAATRSTLNPDDVRFTWAPIPDASLYDLQVSTSPDFPENDNTQGAGSGTQGQPSSAATYDCFTENTSFSPYSQVSKTSTEPERINPTNLSSCFGQSDLGTDSNYFWRVRGLDASGVAVTGKPYAPFQVGVTHDAPLDAPSGASGPVTVTRVTENFYTGSGQTIEIDGTGFTANGTPTVSVGSAVVPPGSVEVVSGTEILALVPAPTSANIGIVDVTVTDGPYSNSVTTSDKFNYGTGSGGISFAGTEVGSWAPTVPFCIKASDTAVNCDGTAVAGTPAQPTTSTANLPDGSGQLLSCGTNGSSCGSTPTLSWAPVTGATEYRIYVSTDAALSNVVRVYETHNLTLTPREDLLDSQAGKTWYFSVQSCSTTACGAVAPAVTFSKRSAPVLASASSSAPAGVTVLDTSDGAHVSTVGVSPTRAASLTYTWGDYTCSSPSGANSAAVTPLNDCRSSNPGEATPVAYHAVDAEAYNVQISSDCGFVNIVDSATVDTNEYTAPKIALGDGAYYVRVQAVDESGSPLTYSGGSCAAPSVIIDRTPPAASVSVGTSGAVTATWSDANGVATPGTATLLDITANQFVPGALTTSGSSVTIAPTPFLVPGHAYGLSVSGATDLAGNVAAATVLPAFTAAAAPIATTTGDGASLKLTYSAPVLGLTADKVHLIADAGHVAVPATVVIVNSTTAEVTASTTLTSNAAYSLYVDAGVTDATGLLQAVTGDVTGSIKSPFPPGITSAHPKEGVYTATVDQAVSGFTADKVHLYTDSTMVDVPASVVVSGSTATVTTAVQLIPGESYGLRVDGGIVGLDHVAVPSGPIPGTFREATKEDSDKLTRNGHWGDRVARGSDGGSALVSGTGNPSLSGKFRSSVLTVAYCVGPMDGYLSISIDGKVAKTLNTRNAFTACGKKLSFRGFSGAIQHTVTFKKTGKKGSAKGGSQVVIDYINAG